MPATFDFHVGKIFVFHLPLGLKQGHQLKGIINAIYDAVFVTVILLIFRSSHKPKANGWGFLCPENIVVHNPIGIRLLFFKSFVSPPKGTAKYPYDSKLRRVSPCKVKGTQSAQTEAGNGPVVCHFPNVKPSFQEWNKFFQNEGFMFHGQITTPFIIQPASRTVFSHSVSGMDTNDDCRGEGPFKELFI